VTIAVIGFLVLWIVVSQAIEKATPQPQAQPPPNITRPNVTPPSKTSGAGAMRTRVQVPPALHPVCDVGPHLVDAGEILTIQLNAMQGQKIKGHLEEVDGQPFDWYMADEKNMVLLKKGERKKFNPIESGIGERAYTVNRKIPWKARWFLILDTYGKVYGREVRVDFEPVADS